MNITVVYTGAEKTLQKALAPAFDKLTKAIALDFLGRKPTDTDLQRLIFRFKLETPSIARVHVGIGRRYSNYEIQFAPKKKNNVLIVYTPIA